MRTDDYARLAEQYLRRLRQEECAHFAGRKQTFDTGQIFDEFGELFSREAVLARLDDRADREGRYLAEFAVYGYIDRELRGLTEAITNEESSASVDCQGKVLPFRAACALLATEARQERRRSLELAVAESVARQNRLRAERIAGQREVAHQLGFADYAELCEEVSGQPLTALGAEMAALANATGPVYRSSMQAAFSRVEIETDGATDADLRWVLMAPRWENLLSREKLIPAAEATLRNLGITLSEQSNLRLDLELRPTKYPRPFCSPIAVPGEVWVVASPRGGWCDYLSLFHELGHAEHFAHTSPHLPVAYRLMGDSAVGESFAFVLQSVVMEREWLRRVMGLEKVPEELLQAGHLLNLWYLRRYAGKLAYELELHRHQGPVSDMMPRYATVLSEAVGARVMGEQYLFDVDDAFYCARYLRAWMFDACLRQYLRQRFGNSWCFDRRSGEWLRTLWERGQQYTVEELAAELGIAFDARILQQQLLVKP